MANGSPSAEQDSLWWLRITWLRVGIQSNRLTGLWIRIDHPGHILDGPLDKWFRSVPLRASESKVFLAILSHETVSHEAVVVYESVSHFKALNDAEVLRVLKANAPLTMMKG